MNVAQAQALIQSHEGLRLKAYRDTRGVLTIGWGCNLQELATRTLFAKLDLNYVAICDGTATLTLNQAIAIFQYQFDVVVASAKLNFSEFMQLPDNASAVICDMIFELGWAGFMEFRDFAAAVKAANWTAAIAAMRDSLWDKQVPGRVENDVLLLQELVK